MPVSAGALWGGGGGGHLTEQSLSLLLDGDQVQVGSQQQAVPVRRQRRQAVLPGGQRPAEDLVVQPEVPRRVGSSKAIRPPRGPGRPSPAHG